MSPLFQEKLIDLLVNIVSIILGGGLISLLIEWRRHRREKQKWEEEDNQVAIDIPRCEMRVFQWKINEYTSEEEELVIHRNNLKETNKQLLIVAQFVIRNTNPYELVITSYEASVLNVTADNYRADYYDLSTYNLVSREDIGTITIKPYGLISRFFVSVFYAKSGNKIDTTPTTLAVEVKTSSGKVIQKKETLNIVTTIPNDVEHYKGVFRPKRYLEKIRPSAEEDDIPF